MSNGSTTTYGHISFRRVISDGNHGNIQIERSQPVIVDSDDPGPDDLASAQTAAWESVISQVNEQINNAFEREDMPAPIDDGTQRARIAYWGPDDSLILIIPRGAYIPGGIRPIYGNAGDWHRLPTARHIANRLVDTNRSIRDCWDFSDGDFTELQTRLDQLNDQVDETDQHRIEDVGLF
jgi:hypothetical protein